MIGIAGRLGCLALLAALASAQESPYIGSAACGTCHPEQHQGQSQTGHARTLYRAGEHPLARRFPPPGPLRLKPKFRFVYSLDAAGFQVAVDDNEFVLDLPLEWAFGSGSHGVTFVSQLDERNYLEHTFSFYAAGGGLGVTTGHESGRPDTLHRAAGLTYRATSEGIGRCFECHSTGGASFGADGGVRVREGGVRCETCHGPGAAHVAGIASSDLPGARLAIDNPNRWHPEELNAFCGDCHRRPATAAAEFDYAQAWNVRHQPPYLARSRCFSEGEGLGCLTCHRPHEALRRDDAAYYRAKCLDCHSDGAPAPAASCGPVDTGDCVACHMPTVRVGEHLAFRNHWIGVYARSNPTVPAR